MHTQHISIKDTGRFSQLICDYLSQKVNLQNFYGHYPSLKNAKNQIEQKSTHFSKEIRSVLVEVLREQYKPMAQTKGVSSNIELLGQENTFTVTTGHQLCLMTGPLYFIYKIISTINLCKQLKAEYPESNFVPVYWMASEDHDFEEISSFQFQDKKIKWNREAAGAVGELPLDDLQSVLDTFESHLGERPESEVVKSWLEKSYRKASNLSEATLHLVHELFGAYGLVVLEPNVPSLKKIFTPFVKEELLSQVSYDSVSHQITELITKYDANYKPQVNPRPINLFYLTPKGRYRIEKQNGIFVLQGTEQQFSESEFLQLLEKHPERFSPNVILRPLYQEVILPNLCYIGGGGEVAYWFQLKHNFDRLKIPFPMLLVRNSALLYSEKSARKISKLGLEPRDLFLDRKALIVKKVKENSEIDLDLNFLKVQLEKQFTYLQNLVNKTDSSFEGAVQAQEKKQLKGIQHLEKRLLKAQKRVLADQLQRVEVLHDALFPNDQLQERNQNFISLYMEIGSDFIPMLINTLDPLNPDFTLIEY
ncbi:bacillithiol biosynthesis cysteine-adding enzyme BshC [Flavobacteriaceae bacterium]|jgi:bacillithiol biosynthesis cysteine-adding enzyme BshC|nr:bacillithiol biosynthesis cysteine-adding enzyme BshC [Flavobacteriaceae bacterium]MDA7808098.1 bacillithiol biosynthesis cysteine-adding enzyme BshC [Flavobacteriaceae bacterium]MDA8877765.1 bacillithiol biosynthesis cysteine-adding enzyme BshC [Flavobacteriaceae bacterium]MDA9587469.1 bacillithiol biosynthesis cysteine-adding enzyme BshC [Flavobacteriaceae bacterium]MDA9851224.1 bacillithiol biosynthesis cysteine-adding enzyme BshC [Flavobacteriaceae bacterium]